MRVQPVPGGDKEARVHQLEEILDKHLGFGTGTSAELGTAPGGTATAHNGIPDNIRGSWVDAVFTAFHTDVVTCYHNLDVPINFPTSNAGENVRWLNFGYTHDGTGATVDSTFSLVRAKDDAYDENSIELRLYGVESSNRTVDADHPVTVFLFFIPCSGFDYTA